MTPIEKLRASLLRNQYQHQERDIQHQPNTALTANRGDDDEPWRYIRVAKALGIIEHLSGVEQLPRAIHDHKGNLSVDWRSQEDLIKHGHTAVEAWLHLDGCDNVHHYVHRKPVSDDVWERDYPGDHGHHDCIDVLHKGVAAIRAR